VYVELSARSAFSFMDGAVAPERLMARAGEMGYGTMALTDAADLGGLVRFAAEAERVGVRPIAGSELEVDGRPVTILARDEAGFRNLGGLVTEARLGSGRGRPGVSFARLAERSEGLHLLTGPASGPLANLLRERRAADAAELLERYRHAFDGRVAVEVQRHHASGQEAALVDALVDLAGRARTPWVVTQGARYLDDRGRIVHDLFTALRTKTTLDEAVRRGITLPNGGRRLRTPEEMRTIWEGREAGLEESARIASECAFSLGWLRPPLAGIGLPPGTDEDAYLRARVEEGARERWGRLGPEHVSRIDRELEMIRKLGFARFFLVMWKAVRFARSRGILCQGRGSAACSAVAYCLEITAVDPVRHHLLFERFLSESRADGSAEPPDIDVDFEMHRREEVLDHVFESYGRQHAAITAVTQEYHAPSAFQDVMRALGYPAEQVAAISKRLHRTSPAEGAELVRTELAPRFGLALDDRRGRLALTAMRAMDGLPRMRSTHPGGFVLSSAPLGEYLPIERTTMGRTIIQFDKDDLDLIGVPKFDFLGLGGLTATRLAFDAIAARTGKRLHLYSLPQDDPETFQMISRGETLGTFQIESRAQIQSLLQTRPEYLYDLVVQVALIRPGPIQGEFVHPYTRRRRGLEQWEHLHPDLAPILDRTRGIPIFQEQAMEISMVLGGFSATEADWLRRTMGHRRKQARLDAALEELRGRLERKVDAATAERLVNELKGFGNYGFPESHAWSFALIAYATAYLRRHYPAEFLLGLLNAWPMGFYPPATLVHDARRHGVEVRPPCLREGRWESTLEETGDGEGDYPAVRIGWNHIRGMGNVALDRLRKAREEGPFRSVEEVVRRAALSRAEALHLARAGAFEAFEPGRRRAAWEALRAAGDLLPLAPARRLPFHPEELEGPENVFLDYLATGISTAGHPMESLRARMQSLGVTSSPGLEALDGGEPIVVAGLVVARQHPETAKGTVFVLMEDEWGFVNVIVPASVYRRNRETVRFSPFLLVEGRFERDGPVMNVIGRRFRTLKAPALRFRSHDFH